MSLVKQIIADLKNDPWPTGTTVATKNKYRMKIVYIMLALSVGAAFVWMPLSIVPLLVAARKYWIIRTDK